jgi:hypothetical protein
VTHSAPPSGKTAYVAMLVVAIFSITKISTASLCPVCTPIVVSSTLLSVGAARGQYALTVHTTGAVVDGYKTRRQSCQQLYVLTAHGFGFFLVELSRSSNSRQERRRCHCRLVTTVPSNAIFGGNGATKYIGNNEVLNPIRQRRLCTCELVLRHI